MKKDEIPEDFGEICSETAGRLSEHRLGYEDLSGYVYFKGMMEGVPDLHQIRHVVVDEAQDYTPIQYAILKQLFPNTRMTLLGDFNQAIHPNRAEFGYDDVRSILMPSTSAVLTLTKSYRSTREIVEFTRTIPGGFQEIVPIQRSGPKPSLRTACSEDGLVDILVKDLYEMLESGLESIGIILKTAAQSRSLYKRLKGRVSARLLDRDDNVLIKGITILPVYLAKGLEFDGAAVYGADDENFGCEGDRKLFYTACTRALHRLDLYYTGKPSPFAAALEK